MKKYFSMLLIVMLFSAFSIMSIPQLAFASESTSTKYEAENATLNKATVKPLSGTGDYAVGASGSGFVGNIDYDDSTITFTVSVNKAGSYEFFLKYATGSDGSTLIVENHEGKTFTVNCSTKKGWGAFNTTPIISTTIDLKEGEQTIVIKKGAQYVELDYIAIGDILSMEIPGLENPTSWTKFEAEDNLFINGVRKNYGGTFSGTGFVGSLDFDSSYLEFRVPCVEDGTYTLKIRYATSGSQTATFYVGNYNKVGRYECYGSKNLSSSGTWGQFTGNDVTINVGLKAGANMIRVCLKYVEVDYIEISNRVGDFVEGSNANGTYTHNLTADGYVKCR